MELQGIFFHDLGGVKETSLDFAEISNDSPYGRYCEGIDPLFYTRALHSFLLPPYSATVFVCLHLILYSCLPSLSLIFLYIGTMH